MFVLVFLALLGLIYGYSGCGSSPLFLYFPPPAHIGAAAIPSASGSGLAADFLAWGAYLYMGFFAVCSTLLILRDTGRTLLGLVYPSDAALNVNIDLATFLLALTAEGCGYYQARGTPS